MNNERVAEMILCNAIANICMSVKVAIVKVAIIVSARCLIIFVNNNSSVYRLCRNTVSCPKHLQMQHYLPLSKSASVRGRRIHPAPTAQGREAPAIIYCTRSKLPLPRLLLGRPVTQDN